LKAFRIPKTPEAIPAAAPGFIDPFDPDDPQVPPLQETPEPSAAVGVILALTTFALRKLLSR
jgi:hypothetical protein